MTERNSSLPWRKTIGAQRLPDGRLILVVESGAKPVEFPLAQEQSFTIGRLTTMKTGTELDEAIVERDERGNLFVSSPHVSSRHVQVDVNPTSGVLVTDLGSLNGTFVGADRLSPGTPVPLSPGDRLVLCHKHQIVFRIRKDT